MYNGECDVVKAKELSKEILKKYSFVREFVIGKTELYRKIYAYTIGEGTSLLLCGAFHGAERITGMMLYRFLDEVCVKIESDERFSSLMQEGGLTVVPIVNPDGVEISTNGVKTASNRAEFVSECLIKSGFPHSKWQANANGVDINHNFDAGYNKVKENERMLGITSPSPTRFGGEYAESERETAALCELCRQKSFKIACALHTQGREIYYDYGENTPSNSIDIAKELSQLSGYEVSHPTGIAVGGGFKDWFIEKFSRPAFTLEIGKGENPLSPSVFDTEYPLASKMLWHLLYLSLNKA